MYMYRVTHTYTVTDPLTPSTVLTWFLGLTLVKLGGLGGSEGA